MRYQDFIIEDTQKAANEVFRYAAAVPEDKIGWKPLDAGRSTLDIAQELAKCPDWAFGLVSGGPTPEMNEQAIAAYKAEIAKWTTVEVCKAECQKRLDKLFELYKDLPDERLLETKWLPFGGGKDFSMPEMMSFPSWNFTYHVGQIAYIQTLYGDRNMY